jgi:hypothetical protein
MIIDFQGSCPYDQAVDLISSLPLPTVYPSAEYVLAPCSCTDCQRRGLGLFESMDFTTWGFGEWALVGLGAYMIFATVSTTKQEFRKAKRRFRR